MGSFMDRVRGFLNIGGGRIKQGFSHDTGDDDLEARGSGQEFKGKVQKKVGDVKSAAGNALHRAGSKVKRTG
jgi:uncharacterized protein YjbJ (UPF0337 family)